MLTYQANYLMGPAVAGALGNLAPLFAVLGGMLLFGEVPAPLQFAGIVTIVAGIVILSLRRNGLTRTWPLWALALPLIASVIRGAAQPISKIGLAIWPSSFAAALFGFTTSTILLAIMGTVQNRREQQPLTRKAVFWFACVGISNGLALLTLYAALTRGSVVLVAPLAATYPLVTLALGALLLRTERITAQLFAGIVVTVIGVAMLLGR